jgi:hypothetical protein
MRNPWPQAGFVLRGPRVILAPGRPAVAWQQLWPTVIAFSFFYGAVMGTFGGVAGDRLWQVMFSAVKLPLLLAGAFLLGLPTFFVLNSLAGVRSDFGAVLRALVASQAGLAVVLGALAPYTALWYATSADYQAATLFNALMFAVASAAAQALLRRAYRPLIARHPAHRRLLRLWLLLYAFVGIQLAWVLRPFIGTPGAPVRFFREDAWGNAYVVVAQLVWGVLTRR